MGLTTRYVSSVGSGTYAQSTSISTPMSLDTALVNAAPGDDVRVMTGTYNRAASDTPTNIGTTASPILFRGADTNGNLLSNARTNGNGPLIGAGFPALVYGATFSLTSKAYLVFELLNITGVVNGALFTIAINSLIKSCQLTNSGSGSTGIANSSINGIIFDCDISLTGTSGGSAVTTNSTTKIIACRINGGPGVGISVSGAAFIVDNTIFSSTGNHIMVLGSVAPLIMNTTLVGGGADGININTAGNTSLQCLINNIASDNAGAGLNMVSTSNTAFVANLRTRDNGSGISNGGDWITATNYGAVTSGNGISDYVSKAGGDFRIVQTSPARNTGTPKFSDIGASQSGPFVSASNVKSGTVYDNGTTGTASGGGGSTGQTHNIGSALSQG